MNKSLILGIVLFIQGAAAGFMASYLLTSEQHTQVKVTTIGNVVDWNFRSNGTKDGDTFVVIQNGDTVLSGVVVNGEWK